MSSPILLDLGLEAALCWLVEQGGRKYGYVHSFKDDGQVKPLREEVRSFLYQSIRELLVNAGKHAQPKRVQVQYFRRDDDACVLVEDDGKGFDPGILDILKVEIKGIGLLTMMERVRYFGGTIKIDSTKGEGTRVLLTVPLDWSAAEARNVDTNTHRR